MDKKFAEDIKNGLLQKPKKLQSKYFYDKTGSEIFQDIMKMPEYYLTDCEYEIFETHKASLLEYFSKRGRFDLIELGSGDGFKTKVLLREFYSQKTDFKYFPIDISKDAIIDLEKKLNEELPKLEIKPLIEDYFFALDELNKNSNLNKVLLFLGSNIGNTSIEASIKFLNEISQRLRKGDQLLIGFDLKKEPKLIMNAYNDPHGITKRFNLNLLDRINFELDGDFDKQKFSHHVTYNPISGRTESFLVSNKEHTATLRKLDLEVAFDYAEPITMELSQKFDEEMISNLATKSGFKVEKNFFDCKHYFCDSLWLKE